MLVVGNLVKILGNLLSKGNHTNKTVQKKPKTITVLEKEGGGGCPERYDHDRRFNGLIVVDGYPNATW